MTLTPQDIQSQQFHVRLRGFDTAEVDAFLETVAEDLQTLVEENARLKDQVVELKTTLKEYQAQEKTFQHAIISAQRIADEIEGRSRRQAEEIVDKAREEAERSLESARQRTRELEEDAAQKLSRLNGEVEWMTKMREEVRKELRKTLENYLNNLDQSFDREAPLDGAIGQFNKPVAPKVNDLADLYTKIEIPSASLDRPMERPSLVNVGKESLFGLDGLNTEENNEEEERVSLDDLDGDLLFTLDDPLDNVEPAVVFDEHDKGRRGYKKI